MFLPGAPAEPFRRSLATHAYTSQVLLPRIIISFSFLSPPLNSYPFLFSTFLIYSSFLSKQPATIPHRSLSPSWPATVLFRRRCVLGSPAQGCCEHRTSALLGHCYFTIIAAMAASSSGGAWQDCNGGLYGEFRAVKMLESATTGATSNAKR